MLVFLSIALGILMSYAVSAPIHPQQKHPVAELEDLGLTEEQMAARLLDWLNRDRISYTLSRLQMNPGLTAIAARHNEKMAAASLIAHEFPDYPVLAERLADENLFFSSFGENVAESETFVTRLIHKGLMDSPPHRRTILTESHTHCGIAILHRGSRWYITQEFAQLFAPADLGETEKTIHERLQAPTAGGPGLTPIVNAHKLLQATARARLTDRPLDPKFPDLGRCQIIQYYFQSPEAIIGDLRREAKERDADACGLGLAFGRNRRYPGGTYALATLFYEKMTARQIGVEATCKALCTRINQIRRSARMRPLQNHTRLGQEAEELAQDVAKQLQSGALDLAGLSPRTTNLFRFHRDLKKEYQANIGVFFFQALEEPSPTLDTLVKTREADRRVGVAVVIPEFAGIPANYFIAVVKLN